MNMKMVFGAVLLSAAFVMPGTASLVGSSVTGTLTFPGDQSNYFDPGYGFVPAGSLNQSSPTVTISGSQTEFAFDDGLSNISADFSANSLVVSDLIEQDGGTNGFELTFTDSLFARISGGSGNLPVTGSSLSGDVITLDFPAANATAGQTFTETFCVAVPEPAAVGLLGAFLVLGWSLTRRHWHSAKLSN